MNLFYICIKLIIEGWKPLGSHQALVKYVQNRFNGNVFVSSVSSLVYSQTMIKE